MGHDTAQDLLQHFKLVDLGLCNVSALLSLLQLMLDLPALGQGISQDTSVALGNMHSSSRMEKMPMGFKKLVDLGLCNVSTLLSLLQLMLDLPALGQLLELFLATLHSQVLSLIQTVLQIFNSDLQVLLHPLQSSSKFLNFSHHETVSAIHHGSLLFEVFLGSDGIIKVQLCILGIVPAPDLSIQSALHGVCHSLAVPLDLLHLLILLCQLPVHLTLNLIGSQTVGPLHINHEVLHLTLESLFGFLKRSTLGIHCLNLFLSLLKALGQLFPLLNLLSEGLFASGQLGNKGFLLLNLTAELALCLLLNTLEVVNLFSQLSNTVSLLLAKSSSSGFMLQSGLLEVTTELLELSLTLLVHLNLSRSGTTSLLEPLTDLLKFPGEVSSLLLNLGTSSTLSLNLFLQFLNAGLMSLDGISQGTQKTRLEEHLNKTNKIYRCWSYSLFLKDVSVALGNMHSSSRMEKMPMGFKKELTGIAYHLAGILSGPGHSFKSIFGSLRSTLNLVDLGLCNVSTLLSLLQLMLDLPALGQGTQKTRLEEHLNKQKISYRCWSYSLSLKDAFVALGNMHSSSRMEKMPMGFKKRKSDER
ncbi:hypothetical protein EYF80_018663 [Liparis tanakae]|uniref:Uncharacterized protein n=1 Tax=Liparis tanakae TaxID=230148 RepID=A0A4Z2I1N4_9TELE|nr:hypothetical protein EYF80_018663 [Liparis tanakae]